MQQLTSTDDVKKLGTILGIWAHPDDESFMMAGLMAMARKNGQTVACITATKGEKGSNDASKWPGLGETRATELEAAFEILGGIEHEWLGYGDAECDKVSDEQAVQAVASLIERFQPDTIVTFGPDGNTGHPDHIAVSRWTLAAAKQAQCSARILYAVDTLEHYNAYLRELHEKFDIYFNVHEPAPVPKENCDVILCLTPEIAELKFEALAAMPSQTQGFISAIGLEKFQKIVDCEAFVNCTTEHKWATPRSQHLTDKILTDKHI